MAELNPEQSFVGQVDAAFKEKVEALSKGSITIDVQYNGVLGNEKQVMDLVMTPGSVVQLVRGTANLETYSGGIPLKSRLLAIPYTFRNDEHFWNFARSRTAEKLLAEPYEKGLGIRGLFYGHEGFRHFFSTEAITSPADLAGKKMRIIGNVPKRMAAAFNAEIVDLPFPKLFAALSTGQVEVAEQPITNYYSNAFYKVAPYMIFDGHLLGIFSVIINADCWDSLTGEQQAILQEAGRHASDYCQQTLAKTSQQLMETMQQEGVTFTPVPDIHQWQEACADMRERAALIDSELYQEIMAF